MNILITLESLSIGGAEITTIRLVKELMKEHKVSIFVLNDLALNNKIEIPEGVKIYTKKINPSILSISDRIDRYLSKLGINFSSTTVLFQSFLNKIIKVDKINLIYSNGLNVDFLIAKNNTPNVKKIVACHCEYKPSYLRKVKFRQNMARYTLKHIDGFVYFNEESLKAFDYLKIQNSIVQKTKLSQFISKEEISIKKSADKVSRVSLGIKESDFVFVSVSRAEKEKGWKETIKAFNEVHKKHPNTHLILVGGDSLHQKGYFNQLKTKNPSPNIHFTGLVSDAFPYIKIADVGLLFSYKEAFGLVVVEYTCLNKPSIATRVGQIEELINKDDLSVGLTIRLLSDGTPDTQEAVKQMLSLIENKVLFETLKENTSIVSEKFYPEAVLDKYLQFFNKILNR